MKYAIYFFIVVFIILLIAGGGYWLFQSLYFVKNTRASQVRISQDASIVFATPSSLPISAKGLIKATVFCLDTRGIGIPGLQTTVQLNKGIVIHPDQPVTDARGRALFSIEGVTPGSYDLAVFCQGTQLDAKMSFSFL